MDTWDRNLAALGTLTRDVANMERFTMEYERMVEDVQQRLRADVGHVAVREHLAQLRRLQAIAHAQGEWLDANFPIECAEVEEQTQ